MLHVCSHKNTRVLINKEVGLMTWLALQCYIHDLIFLHKSAQFISDFKHLFIAKTISSWEFQSSIFGKSCRPYALVSRLRKYS